MEFTFQFSTAVILRLLNEDINLILIMKVEVSSTDFYYSVLILIAPFTLNTL